MPTAEEAFGFDPSKGKIISYDISYGLDVEIPATIGGVAVTTIGDFAFSNNDLISVTIPDSVTMIGGCAFANNHLTNVMIGESVTEIEEGVFQNNDLTNVTIPDSVTMIGRSAFADNHLTSVKIGDSVTRIEDDAFWNNDLTSVTIPDSVTSLGSYAFAKNHLISVTIGKSVTYIDNSVFWNNDLTSVIIPESVTSLGSYAFADNHLTSVVLPKSVISIDEDDIWHYGFKIEQVFLIDSSYSDIYCGDQILKQVDTSIKSKEFFTINLQKLYPEIDPAKVNVIEISYCESFNYDSSTGEVSIMNASADLITLSYEYVQEEITVLKVSVPIYLRVHELE